ncbi:CTP synthase [Humibacter soli]
MSKKAITIADAAALMMTRDDLLLRGMTERAIEIAVRSGTLRRIRRGWFVRESAWAELWPEGRHLLHVLAVAQDARGSDPVFAGPSAAVLQGLPLYRYKPKRVEVLVASPRHIRSTPDVLRHEGRLASGDIARVGGIGVTAVERTVVDLARTLGLEAAVSVADASLRAAAVDRYTQDDERAGVWRDSMAKRVANAGGQRGIRQARWVIAFADGRAQLPGESASRTNLHRIGVRNVRTQVRVPAPDGGDYWTDFALDDFDSFGEFDGVGKYLDEAMRSGRTLEQVVLDEKRREDWIRGTTGRRVVRWGDEDAASPGALARRLRAFGFVIPGR